MNWLTDYSKPFFMLKPKFWCFYEGLTAYGSCYGLSWSMCESVSVWLSLSRKPDVYFVEWLNQKYLKIVMVFRVNSLPVCVLVLLAPIRGARFLSFSHSEAKTRRRMSWRVSYTQQTFCFLLHGVSAFIRSFEQENNTILSPYGDMYNYYIIINIIIKKLLRHVYTCVYSVC